MKRGFLFYVGIFSCLCVWAQKTVVTGTVTTPDGERLPGVNILVKGTTKGVLTDLDGNYKIGLEVDEGVLIFSYIGFESQEVEVGNQSKVDVSLQEDSKQLSEVIIVGYGSQSRESLTGSVQVVDQQKIDAIPTPSFQEALQGNSPGLQVVTTDGAPGAGISIRVRGIGSISAGNEPLYVIDGIPVNSESENISTTDFDNGGRSANLLASINPNDIESLVVLKDAASTAIYGSRGANGVVLINTKGGLQGKAKVNFKSQWGFSSFAFNNLLEGLSEPEYRALYIEGKINAGDAADETAALEIYNNEFPDQENNIWLDEMSQTGVTEEYDLSISGGSNGLTYFTSLNYYGQEGTIKENFFDRYSGRIKLKADVAKGLTFSNNLSISYFEQRGITDGARWQAPMYLAYLMPPTVPMFDNEGNYYAEHTGIMGANHPVGQLYDDMRQRDQTRVINTFSASYEIMENLTFKSSWSVDLLNIDDFIYNNPRYGDGRNAGGTAQEATVDQLNWLGTQTLSYTKSIGRKHHFDAVLGYEAQKVSIDQVDGYAEGFAHPSLVNLSSAANASVVAFDSRTEYAFASVLGRVMYDYGGKYLGSFSVRSDGSSRFGPENRWGTFWSVGAGWVVSEESFMSSNDLINFMKVRSSYGVAGNAAIGNSTIGNYAWSTSYAFDADYDGSPGGYLSNVGDESLTWESQENFNIGVDYSLLGDRLSGSIEYFERISSDLILEDPRSPTSGVEDIITNVGDMENRGIEISLSGDVIRTPNFQLTIGGNISFIKNEITRLETPIPEGTKRREEGRDFQEYYLYGWAGVDPANGDPLWFTDSTKTETTNDINNAVRFYDGKSATPDYYGGFNLAARYKGFTLSTQFNFQVGNYLYDSPGFVIHGDGRFTPRSTSRWAYENRWTTPGEAALFPRFAWGNTSSSNVQNQTRYLFEGDFIRMRTLRLAYDVPAVALDRFSLISKLNVYVNFNNFWTWVKDENLHFDPEQTISGVYNTVTPISKTVTLGLNCTF
ncbi:MAG: TonB-dependent receptor [Bacteroidota bacterium]